MFLNIKFGVEGPQVGEIKMQLYATLLYVLLRRVSFNMCISNVVQDEGDDDLFSGSDEEGSVTEKEDLFGESEEEGEEGSTDEEENSKEEEPTDFQAELATKLVVREGGRSERMDRE